MLFARSQLGFSFHDRAFRFVYLNDVLARIGGLPQSAYEGRTFEEVLPEVAPVVVPYLRQVLATGEPLLAQAFRADERAWLLSYYPVHAPDGEIVGVGAVALDDTERRRAERLLRDSEERYRVLVDMSPDAIVTITAGSITFANPAAARLVGAPEPAAIIGRLPWDLVHPDDRERAQSEFAEAMRTRAYHAYEGRFLRLDGTDFIGS